MLSSQQTGLHPTLSYKTERNDKRSTPPEPDAALPPMTFLRLSLAVGLVASLSIVACSGATAAGGSCTKSGDCAGNVCMLSADFPSGYCTQACTLGVASTCPSGSVCVDDASGAPAGSGIKSVCYQSCKVNADCGNGYACKEKAGQLVCKM